MSQANEDRDESADALADMGAGGSAAEDPLAELSASAVAEDDWIGSPQRKKLCAEYLARLAKQPKRCPNCGGRNIVTLKNEDEYDDHGMLGRVGAPVVNVAAGTFSRQLRKCDDCQCMWEPPKDRIAHLGLGVVLVLLGLGILGFAFFFGGDLGGTRGIKMLAICAVIGLGLVGIGVKGLATALSKTSSLAAKIVSLGDEAKRQGFVS